MDPAARISGNTVERTYLGKTYRLQHILIGVSQKECPNSPFPGAVNFWCQKLCNKSLEIWDKGADSLVTIHNPFYPTWQELRADVWIKISKPRVLEIFEGIWADPSQELGGVRGVSKYCSVICTHACIDFKRKQEVRYRRGELFPSARLDDPCEISCEEDGVNEDSGTRADLISDDEGLRQAFELTDLKPLLTELEYTVLHGVFADRKKIRELASDFGMSKSAVDRVNQSAQKKVADWFEYLKTAPALVAKAHLCPVFTRASLRPNRISKENLEGWKKSLQIVSFYDPAGEYRPVRIVQRSQPVRAKKECTNPDCRNGVAIDRITNLTLPSGLKRIDENVRFLPAKTSRNNVLCPGCASSKSATRVTEIPVATRLVPDLLKNRDAFSASSFYLGENELKSCNPTEIVNA